MEKQNTFKLYKTKLLEQVNRNKVIVLMLLIFLAIQIPYIIIGLSGAHRWRQADTAAVARNYYQESPNFFLPRLDMRGDKTGITGMEFPFYNYLVSILYRIFNNSWFGWGQIVSLIFTFLFLFQMITILKQLEITFNRKYIFIFVCLINPLLADYSVRFMPETCALFFATTGNILFFKYIKNKNLKTWMLTCLFFSLSILIRPYIIFLCLPVLMYAIDQFIKYKKIDIPVISIGIFILLPFFLWYKIYCPYLISKYGIRYLFFGKSLFESFQITYLTLKFWFDIPFLISQELVSWPLLLFFLLGLYILLSKFKNMNIMQKTYIFYTFLILLFGLPLLVGTHHFGHHYYLFASIPSLSIISAVGLDNFIKKYKKTGIILLIIFSIFMGNRAYTYKKDKDLKRLSKIMPLINRESTKKDLFIVVNQGIPVFLYVINRNGWAISKRESNDLNSLKNYFDKGAKFIIKKDDNDNFNLIKLETLFQTNNIK